MLTICPAYIDGSNELSYSFLLVTLIKKTEDESFKILSITGCCFCRLVKFVFCEKLIRRLR